MKEGITLPHLESGTKARVAFSGIFHERRPEVSLRQCLQPGQPHFLQQVQAEAPDRKVPLHHCQQVLVFLLNQTPHLAEERNVSQYFQLAKLLV